MFYHQEKEEKREMLRNKYEKKEEDLIFRPRINSQSKTITRKLDDLYDWKNKVDGRKEERKKLNDKENEMTISKKFVPNANSVMINKINNYSNFKKNISEFQPNKSGNQSRSHNRSQDDIGLFENGDEIEFDLWPDINKIYVKEGASKLNTENTYMN